VQISTNTYLPGPGALSRRRVEYRSRKPEFRAGQIRRTFLCRT
jgi:hypothetical protein